ncbi:Pol protein [Phytophthora palmivora]|uniref:Pol protein n=1 Tax=Phytophthora palmivora TaxID=4796 RepID=A0A2P4XUV5_9STRA|nr:Pol protein [Phytophthora palmivora]
MLLEHEVHIHTDHLNLTNGTYNNYACYIEEFGPELNYVKGESNVVADTLSRLPRAYDSDVQQQQETLVAVAVMDLTTLSNVDLREIARCQKRDGTATLKSATTKDINGVELQVDSKHGPNHHPLESAAPIIAAYPPWCDGHVEDDAECIDVGRHGTQRREARPQLPHLHEEQASYGQVRQVAGEDCSDETMVRSGERLHRTVQQQKFRAVTMIDTTARLVAKQSVADASSDETAYLFDRLWLCRYPRPGRVIYDQGTEFKKEFFELLESDGIAAVPTTIRNPQANSVIERRHRVIGDKMRAEEIVTYDDWENSLHNATFALRALRASVHSMLGVSPAQATFGCDMIFDVEHTADWHAQRARKIQQPGDRILLKRDGNINSKLTTLYDGPYTVLTVRDNGTLVIDKGRYTETVHIRRVVPYKDQRGEACGLPDKTQDSR